MDERQIRQADTKGQNSMTIPFITGIEEIIDRYDHFILDIFGVIHDGIAPFPGTITALTQLKSTGKQICCLSNSPRRAAGAAAQMHAMGIDRNFFDHVVTSGEATYDALKHREQASADAPLGNDCWFIDTDIMSEVLNGQGLNILNSPSGASFILNSIPGLGDTVIEELHENLHIAAENNLPMICANPDLVVNIGAQQYKCAGTYAKYYEDIGGHVIYHGKPHAPVYTRCYDLLGRPDKSRICAIGDSFHTDIAGANNFGFDSVANLVGIHWEEIHMDHAPDQADHEKLATVIASHPHKPTYTMAGFDW